MYSMLKAGFVLACAGASVEDDSSHVSLLQKAAHVLPNEPIAMEISSLQAMANDPVYDPALLADELPPVSVSFASDGLAPVRVNMSANGDTRPRVLIMDGCSSSTYVQVLAIKLLEAHGVQVQDAGEGGNHKDKLLKHVSSDLHPDELALLKGKGASDAQAIGLSIKAEQRQGRALTFKIGTEYSRWDPNVNSMSNTLSQANAQTTLVWRDNVVDWMVCRVRDCFGDSRAKIGYPVTPDGKEDHTCFARRNNPGKTTLAKLDTKKLADWITKFGPQHRNDVQQTLVKTGALKQSTPIKAEALLSFEYKNGNMENSVKAWENLLSNWGVNGNTATIKKVLSSQQMAGALPAPSPHSQVIYNYGEVKSILQKHGFGQYLRG